MANTFKFGNGNWAVKDGSALAYNDENNNFKPLPFDFTRASSATMLNRQGLIETVGSGKPRIDFFNNTDGHLLLEPLRRNFLTYSEDFSNWTLNGDSISETSSTAFGKPIWTLTESSSSFQGVFISATGVTIGTITASVLVRSSASDLFRLRFGATTNKNVDFNLSSGTVTSGSSGANGTINSYGDGWYLCTMSVTATSSTQSFAIYTNSGSVDVIHAQLEAGSYATSYIPTEGSSVTRVVELMTQTPPSGIIGQTEGTLYIDFTPNTDEATTKWLAFLGSGSQYIGIYILSNAKIRLEVANTTSQALFDTSFTITKGQRYKCAIAYANNDFTAYVNGTQLGTDTNGSVPTTSTIRNYYNTSSIEGTNTNDLKIYDTRLTDTELQNLTS